MSWLKRLFVKFLFKYIADYIGGKGATMLKAGIKSTEFWLSIAAIVANIWMGVSGFIPAETMALIIAGVACVYAIARAVVKFTKTTVDDKFLDDLAEKLKPLIK